MSKLKIYFSLLAIVILVFFTLKTFGIINFSLIELIAFGTCLLGFYKAIDGFDSYNRWKVFYGTIIFLSSLTIIIFYHFEFFNPAQMFIPATLMIIGGGFFMLFLTATENIMLIFISAVLNGFALMIIIHNGRTDLLIFLRSVLEIIYDLWYLLLMLLGLIYFVRNKK